MNNVLVLAAGRRVELVQAFQADLSARISGAGVFAADLRPALSPACHTADRAFRTPRVDDPAYPDFLLGLCRENRVGLVIPTIDTDLFLLAQQRARFAAHGVHLIVSDPELVAQCRDKRRTAKLFEVMGVDTPAIYARDGIRYPAFAKPYDGSSGVGAARIGSPEFLTPAMLADEKLMFMECIGEDHVEYTVDVYYDRNGKLRCLVPRQRMEVRSGEVSKGITRRNSAYDYLLARLSKLVGARGCLTVQLFVNAQINTYAAIEINPRFGGGYPLSYSAGATYPGWLVDEYLLDSDVPFFDQWESDLLMLRYDAKVLVRDSGA